MEPLQVVEQLDLLHATCTVIANGDTRTRPEPGERLADFEARYGCIQPDDSGTFSFEQVSDTDPSFVWSLVDGERRPPVLSSAFIWR